MKQSRHDYAIMKDSLIGISFGSELKFVCYQKCWCVVQVIIQHHGSVVLQRGVGSVERAHDRDQPKLQRTSCIA